MATLSASATVSAKTDTQSSVRHAGTTPRVLSQPLVGLSPTMLLKPAGTRPEPAVSVPSAKAASPRATTRSEEHTSELQSLMRISYAVFCLKKKNKNTETQ